MHTKLLITFTNNVTKHKRVVQNEYTKLNLKR
jgi:hypothetical protein